MISPSSATTAAADVRIVGVVQGVGFRPFVHRLATRHGLAGSVRNESGGVAARLEGPDPAIRAFMSDLAAEAPPLARIDELESTPVPPRGETSFRVLESRAVPGERLPVSPDVATCAACEAELRDPSNRRFGHPFITCTDCGPRYSVIEAMPYDRERTTMRRFTMCSRCEAEYAGADDRRYHSETNSCPGCGPRLWLESSRAGGEAEANPDRTAEDPIPAAAARLREGAILAVRSVGGFHLVADATNDAAVERLRRRKGRDDKPLAILVSSLDEARRVARVGTAEAELLCSAERPIVLLSDRTESGLASAVSPGLSTVGVMLPAAPHQALLAEAAGRPLIFTSGNRTDEPLAAGNTEARARLAGIADWFLLHDREIAARIDDSVVRVVELEPVLLRRARGYAPLPIASPIETPRPLLAVGAHLKSTFALMTGDRVFLSPHIGDLEDIETFEHFEATLSRFRDLFGIDPQVVARDLHPGYMSTLFADRLGLRPVLQIQHHHAHVAAVAAEHGVTDPVLGVAFDGTGLGDDGRIWGAEFLLSTPTGYRRLAHLRYAPLPGGDLAARHPWRAAAGYLSLSPGALAGAAFDGVPERERTLVETQIERRLNAPEWSSMGRLFDAAAAILGVRTTSTYEGQAAMELESLAGDEDAAPLPFPWHDQKQLCVLDPVPLLDALARGLRDGHGRRELAAGFHDAIARTTTDLVTSLSREHGIGRVALGGGVFQNARLLASTCRGLSERGLEVLVPRALSPNDGAICYGQAVIAAARLQAAERS